MSYEAKVFNVMIASPGDVASERTIIRDVIYEWNAVHSKSRNIVLLPVGWESHSSPEMGASPQEIINNQVLDKCDFLIGVFWTRIGTPTTEYASGTVEEIEKHISTDKPAMLYFSSQPVVMDTVDPNQYAELSKFKKSCQTRGLYQSYDSQSDFKDKFYRHLQLKINEHSLFKFEISESLLHQTEVIKSKTSLPTLSNEARILLKEASLDSNGTIMSLRYIGGEDIQTNGKNLISSQQPREVARWKSALQELKDENLIEDRGYKGEIFRITNLGYQIADMIEL
ncbi:DUF4062 domain-containing protein [Acinetobacter pittii]|uniref:DUF4062 domain-containing protein n=1 Tax=Acinetobacter pittii TaxID=48296 RepID=UPI00190252C9|nr:DUF4062 domain-containing protein [Acinetobacter pittii]MBJ8478837.1 DUF4062 domain-containing protein [Acinetobacter pittii]MCU4340867.1 DUF4062 domain-containing protein [Acinetobacter pittii]MCU4560094.1 DUF4062 domain-containing protein [Acinetobacter pittii]